MQSLQNDFRKAAESSSALICSGDSSQHHLPPISTLPS